MAQTVMEITPAMIEAGVTALSYRCGQEGDTKASLQEAVEEVFLAMMAARKDVSGSRET
jgi:hypothetical protein